mgnify:CR=1 FL=1
MTTLSQRVDLLGAMSKQGQVRQKSERLTVLVGLLSDSQHEHEKAKANLTAFEALLEERADILLASVEGKNAETRKAGLVVAKQADQEWQQLLNMVNTARAKLLDTALGTDRLKREWAVLHLQIHVFTATLGFLAGGNGNDGKTTVD